MFEYQPLDASRNEIRLITVLLRTGVKRGKKDDASRSSSLSSSSFSSTSEDDSSSQSDVEEVDVDFIEHGLSETSIEYPPRVECRLEHVSLDEFTPKYLGFLNNLKDETGTTDLYLKWTRSLVEEWPEGYPDDLAKKDLQRWVWGDYFALSYLWGDATDHRAIIVNGTNFDVTENLEAALQEISTQQSTFRIWVDALCINQNDLDERAHEVKRMKDIYSGASKVVAWMGPRLQNTIPAFEIIEDIATRTRKWTSSSRLPEDDVIGLWESIRTDESRYTSNQWLALGAFLELPYWNRVWIIQELVMTNYQALIAWGNESCTLQDLVKALDTFWLLLDTIALRICQARKQPQYGRLGLHGTIVHLKMIFEIKNDYTSQDKYPQLGTVMDLSRNSEASDPRDHVYGLAGLFQPDLSKIIAPDYTASIKEVFRDFALSVIDVTGSLDIICQTRRGHDLENSEMPSWVPDFSKKSKDYITALNPLYHAAGTSKPVLEYSRDKNLLRCQGFAVDLVDGHGCNCDGGENDTHDVFQPATLLRPYNTPEDVIKALWNAFSGGRYEHVDRVTHELFLKLPWLSRMFLDSPLKNAELYILDRFQQCNQTVDLAGKTLPAYFPKLTSEFEVPLELVHGNPNVMHPFSDIVRRLLARKLFTTWRGYIGMGPPNLRQGDCIYILLGCSLPVVLRPCGENSERLFKFVGECYIHSIMHGEALEWLSNGDVKCLGMETVTMC